MKKHVYLVFIGMISLGLVIFTIFKPRDFSLEYAIDDYSLNETYDKDIGYYHFKATVNNTDYEISLKDKYKGKKLIEKIDLYESEDVTCVTLKSDKIKLSPICKSGDEFLDVDLLDTDIDDIHEEAKSSNIEFEKIEFMHTLGLNYGIWNHKGYYYINDLEQKTIEFLEDEEYYNSLSIIVDNYILTPNYDENYNFTSLYILDLKKGKLETWDLKVEISYNSYYMGALDGKVYLIDRKNSVEYSMDPKKKKVEIKSKDGRGMIWDNGWKDMSMTKLVSTDYTFPEEKVYEYHLEDNSLYLHYRDSKSDIKVSNLRVDKIVTIKDDLVFYLVKDKLYIYSPSYGEIEIASYSEWDFNDVNSIFVY